MVPFKSGMVVVGRDFCGRPEETERLKDELARCSRVCLVGERRIGKTSLVHETVRQQKGHSLVFIDFLCVKSSSDVIRRIVEGIFRTSEKTALSRVAQAFASLRPVISADPLTGTPALSLAPGLTPPPDTLEGALDYLGRQKKTTVFFDEFQALLDLPPAEQTDLLARMRSRIQLHSETPYVFAGSVRGEMDRMFFDHSSPFYKSAIRFELGPLRRSSFSKFIRNSFTSGKRSISDVLLSRLFELCHDVPGDIQRLCQCLWDETSSGDNLDTPLLERALLRLFSNEERAYSILVEYVTGQQLKCLRALSEQGGTASLGGEFLAMTGITTNSSVQRAMNSLVKKRILFRDGKAYRFCDPFFGEWVKYNKL
jgi:AAA+ ATPase superfamily predicted ATPase